MKQKWLVVAGIAVAAVAAIGINVRAAQAQKEIDRESLTAQRKLKPSMGPGGRVDEMAEKLGLSQTQKDQMQAAEQEMRTRMESMQSSGMDPQAAMQAMQAHQKRIESILTPDQRSKMQSMMASQMPGGFGPGGFPPNSMPADAKAFGPLAGGAMPPRSEFAREGVR